MKKLIVNCQIKLTDVYDDSWCPDPSYKHVIDTLEIVLKRCLSNEGTVDIFGLVVTNEVI